MLMSRFAVQLLAICCFANVATASVPACSILSESFTDTIPPTIICPPSDTLTLGPAECTQLYPFNVTAFDDQPGTPALLQTSGLSATEPYPIGLTINIFRATDAAGNSSTCSFTVLVQNYTVPLVCEALTTVALNQNCSAQPDVAYYLFGDNDDYGCLNDFVIEVDRTAPFGNGPWQTAVYGPADVGKTYMARVTDIYNGNKCWGNVKIIDNLAPTLSCSTIDLPCAITNPTPDHLADDLGIAAAKPTATDNCGGQVTLTFYDSAYPLGCDTIYQQVIYRHWTAKDERGNTSTCIQQIRFVRQTLDDVQLPPDLTLNCLSTPLDPETTGYPTLPTPFGPVRLDLADCAMNFTYGDTLVTLECSGHRQLLRKWLLINWCQGNVIEHQQVIDLRDSSGPLVLCPASLTVSLNQAGCSGPVDLPDAVLNETCSRPAGIFATWTDLNGQPDTLIGTLADFAANNPDSPDTLGILGIAADFPVGANVVRYIATDDCGNAASCSFVLQVWDTSPPAAACAPLQTVWLGADGKATFPAAQLDGGSTADSCNTLEFRVKPIAPSICAPGSDFAEQLEFCCAEAGDTLSVTLRAYDVNLPAGPVPAGFANGHFSECVVQVAIADSLAPACIAPPDTVVACAVFDASLADYGTMITTCKVDSIAVVLDKSSFDSLCGNGTLLRTFYTFSNGVAGGSCVQQITVNYSQNYFVRFPDDVILFNCNGNDLFGEPQFYGLNCEKMEVTFEDEVFTIVPDACFKIERTWTITNRCTYDAAQPLTFVPNPAPNALTNNLANLPGPVVSASGASNPWAPTVVKINPTDPQPTNFSTYWSENTNGYFYKQIIKVIDTQGPVISCPAVSATLYDSSANDPQLWHEAYWSHPYSNINDLCEAEAALSISAGDACGGADVIIDYQLFLDLDGDGSQETVVKSNNLPGANNVQYGNSMNPNFSGGTARSFDERPVPANEKYRFAIDQIKDGNHKIASVRWDTEGSPVNPADSALTGVLPQLPTGTHRIKWIVKDGCGNESTCSYQFTLVGLTDDCQPPSATIGGEIETETGAGVNKVSVALNNAVATLNQADTTSIPGLYSFAENLELGSNFEVIPTKHDNPANGLSTFDLVLLSKHILGIEPLNSPYKIIAGDINHSNSVTSFDIVELRKLILGIYTVFPANTSWRFVPKEFAFPDLQNPFATAFPETIKVDSLLPNGLLSYDFVGIKTGDLNNSALPNAAVPAEDRNAGTLWFELDNRRLQTGETFSITFRPDEPPVGFQFTLEHPGLDLIRMLRDSEGLDVSYFGVFDHAFTSCCTGRDALVFTAFFRTETTGRLSDMLRLSDRITRSEGYLTQDKNIVQAHVGLRFNDGAGAASATLTNVPNPFTDKTLLQFYLPKKSNAALSVFDLHGRPVWQKEGVFEAGEQSIQLDRAALGSSGVYYLELKTPGSQLLRKMVLLDE